MTVGGTTTNTGTITFRPALPAGTIVILTFYFTSQQGTTSKQVSFTVQ